MSSYRAAQRTVSSLRVASCYQHALHSSWLLSLSVFLHSLNLRHVIKRLKKPSKLLLHSCSAGIQINTILSSSAVSACNMAHLLGTESSLPRDCAPHAFAMQGLFSEPRGICMEWFESSWKRGLLFPGGEAGTGCAVGRTVVAWPPNRQTFISDTFPHNAQLTFLHCLIFQQQTLVRRDAEVAPLKNILFET